MRECDIGLIVETLENTDMYTPTISRIAGIVIIDTLATSVALRRDCSARLQTRAHETATDSYAQRTTF
jgi:RpiR family carbohydrate utilization transcriptional regulator